MFSGWEGVYKSDVTLAMSYCLMTKAHVCEQLAKDHYMKVKWSEFNL